jgi:hypothetical protein
MKTFEQKYFFEKRIFSIVKDGVITNIESTGDDIEDFVPFEEISTKILRMKQTQFLYLYLGLMFLSINLIFLIKEKGLDTSWQFLLFFTLSLTFGVILMCGYFKESVPFKFIQCENAIILFFYNRPNKAAVDKFIETIIEMRNNYLKDKYMRADETMTYDLYLIRLRMLMEEEIIDSAEYESLKNQFLNEREMHSDLSFNISSEANSMLN